MALNARLSLNRRRLGLIIAAVICVVLLFVSLAPSARDADSPHTDEVVADSVEQKTPDVAQVPVTSSDESAMAMEMAEQQLSSFASSTFGEAPHSGEFDVALFTTSIEEDPATLSMVDLEDQLFGVGPMLFASAGALPDTLFVSGGPYRSNRTGGFVGFGVGGHAGGGSGGGGSSGENQTNQHAGSVQNDAVTNPNNQSGSSSGNGPGNHSGNGPGGSSDSSGHSGHGDKGFSDESPLPSGSGPIREPEPISEGVRTVSVPEPSVFTLMGVGLATLATMRRRRVR